MIFLSTRSLNSSILPVTSRYFSIAVTSPFLKIWQPDKLFIFSLIDAYLPDKSRIRFYPAADQIKRLLGKSIYFFQLIDACKASQQIPVLDYPCRENGANPGKRLQGSRITGVQLDNRGQAPVAFLFELK